MNDRVNQLSEADRRALGIGKAGLNDAQAMGQHRVGPNDAQAMGQHRSGPNDAQAMGFDKMLQNPEQLAAACNALAKLGVKNQACEGVSAPQTPAGRSASPQPPQR